MDRTPILHDPSRTEIIYDTETKMYAMYLGGELVGFAHTYVDADATLAELHPPYPLLLDAAGEPGDDVETEPYDGEGDEWASLSSEQRGEIDHLCRCADGQHILDWAYPDALAAHVGRGLRDCYHPMLGERVQAWPSGDVGVLLAVDELGYLIVDGSTRICLPRERVERIAYYTPAAAPTSPVAPPLQPPSAGDAAASAAGPCDVSGCRAPGSTVWLGRWPAYPARLCGAHRKAVA